MFEEFHEDQLHLMRIIFACDCVHFNNWWLPIVSLWHLVRVPENSRCCCSQQISGNLILYALVFSLRRPRLVVLFVKTATERRKIACAKAVSERFSARLTLFGRIDTHANTALMLSCQPERVVECGWSKSMLLLLLLRLSYARVHKTANVLYIWYRYMNAELLGLSSSQYI